MADHDAFSELVAAGQPADAPERFAGGTIQKRSISEQVANRIMAMIKSGNLRPGDRLPTEQQMGMAFGISRPPLREALKALTLMGVLESRQGGRYSVTDLSASRLIAPFSVMLSIGDYDVHDHFEARTVVDLDLVARCTDHATPEQKLQLKKIAADGRAFHDDPVAFRLNDIAFHQAIYDAGGSALLSAMAQGLYDVGLDLRRIASTLPGVIEKSVGQHCAVAEAISAPDRKSAANAYRQHLEHVRDTTIQSMRVAPGDARPKETPDA